MSEMTPEEARTTVEGWLKTPLAENSRRAIRVLLAEVERLKADYEEAWATLDERESRIEAALALHERHECAPNDIVCWTCDTVWPCPTVKALKGE